MVRNQETWDLGEPTKNDSGQPTIHDIVSKLDCICDLPDNPTAFLDTAHELAGLRAQLQAAEDKEDSENDVVSPTISTALFCSDFENWNNSESYDVQYTQSINPFKYGFHDISITNLAYSFDTARYFQLPVFPDYPIEPLMYPRTETSWGAGDDSLDSLAPFNITPQLLYQQESINTYSTISHVSSIGECEDFNIASNVNIFDADLED
jgi:hypothetical protein